jgi:hypothetical protein
LATMEHDLRGKGSTLKVSCESARVPNESDQLRLVAPAKKTMPYVRNGSVSKPA